MLGTFFDVPFLIHLNLNNLTGQADLTGFATSWQRRSEKLIPLKQDPKDQETITASRPVKCTIPETITSNPGAFPLIPTHEDRAHNLPVIHLIFRQTATEEEHSEWAHDDSPLLGSK